MSGLYNMLHGYHPHASIAMAVLERDPGDFGRFRDAWFERNGDGVPRIAVYTRNGGGNRDDYADVFAVLREHPCYLHDADDDFDGTYATIYFSIPEKHLADINAALPADTGVVDTSERWQAAIEAISKADVPG